MGDRQRDLMMKYADEDASVIYRLNDDFTTDLAAGAVNGTLAEPGGIGTVAQNTRTVVDTDGKLILTGGAVLLTPRSPVVTDDPMISWGSHTRVAGLTLVTHFNNSTAWGTGKYGFTVYSLNVYNPNGLYPVVYLAPGNPKLVDTLTLGIDYYVAIVVRANGAFFFFKGGVIAPTWTLIYYTTELSNTPVIPAITNRANTYRSSFAKIANDLFIPVPLASDSFGRANGALGVTDGAAHAEANGGGGLAWTNQIGTTEILTNAAICTALDGGIAAATVPTGSPDVIAQVALTRGTTSAGMVLRYVDAANYLYILHDGTNVKFIKRVAGVETELYSVAKTYSAGKLLTVILTGTKARAIYNFSEIGNDVTVPASTSDLHGIYFKDTDSIVDNFQVWPRGSEGQYAAFDRFLA